MTFEAALAEIQSRYVAQIATPLALPTQYDNAPFERPAFSIWARLQTAPAASALQQVGQTKRWRVPGIMTLQIFSPPNVGDKAAIQVVDAMCTAFRSRSVNGVTYRTPSARIIGFDGKWWQTNVVCPFHFDHIGS